MPSISDLIQVRRCNFVDQLIDNGNHAVLLKVSCENSFLSICILVFSPTCVFFISCVCIRISICAIVLTLPNEANKDTY